WCLIMAKGLLWHFLPVGAFVFCGTPGFRQGGRVYHNWPYNGFSINMERLKCQKMDAFYQ
ncbi:MAG: hypothetical protein K9N22_10055, partial [Candidatus Marinimicrobia bacterium]|nr:hypothetical protein [Candidatus Neomarinimicrobiota bacterium]